MVTLTTLVNDTAQVGSYRSGISVAPTTVQIVDHTTSSVVVTATKVDQTQGAQVALRAVDTAGNVANCDPVFDVVSRDPGKPAVATYTGLAQTESHVHIYNQIPGVTHLTILVNDRRFELTDSLKDGETIAVDTSSAMIVGAANTISIETTGKPGGSAIVVIGDS